jgi:hypothetical protein
MPQVSSVDAAETAEAGPWLLDEPTIEFAFSVATKVPGPVHVTVTVIEVPDVGVGVNTQPFAVPVFEKSDDERPDTDSLNVSV